MVSYPNLTYSPLHTSRRQHLLQSGARNLERRRRRPITRAPHNRSPVFHTTTDQRFHRLPPGSQQVGPEDDTSTPLDSNTLLLERVERRHCGVWDGVFHHGYVDLRLCWSGVWTRVDSEVAELIGKDALCCDVFVPISVGTGTAVRTGGGQKGPERVRVRLVNVHLDSLATNNSLRLRQVVILAAYLRAAGRGIVAGDFNAVGVEDADLPAKKGLVDCWAYLRSEEPGFT
jgi:hypothetical protein